MPRADCLRMQIERTPSRRGVCGGIQQIQSNAVRVVLLLESDGNELSTRAVLDLVDVHGELATRAATGAKDASSGKGLTPIRELLD